MKNQYLIIFCIFFFFSEVIYAQNIKGTTVTGIPGITKTVGEIQAFANREEALHGLPLKPAKLPKQLPPELPGPGEEARRSSTWPVQANSTEFTASVSGVTQSIHSNFMATSFFSHSGGWPPDNNGDVGTTQVFIAQNFRLVVYAKPSITDPAVTTPNGTSTVLLASPVLNVSANDFFRTAFAVVNAVDPHVRFDRLTSRWFIVAMSTNETTNNYLLFAVSSGPTISSIASFTFFRIQLSTFPAGNADIGKFLDYPTLGIDANSLLMGSNIFTSSSGSYSHSSGYVVDKSDMIAGTLTITPFGAIGTAAASPGFRIRTPQGVHNDDPVATESYIIGSSGFLSELIIRKITYPAGITTLGSEIVLAVNTTVSPVTQPALSSPMNLDASNTRLFAAMMMKNKITGVSTLWTSHTIRVNTLGVGSATDGRNASRWYELENLNGIPTLRQSGTLFNNFPTASNPRGFWFPAIAMSGQGHSVMAASTAAPNAYIDLAMAGRYRTTALGDTEDSVHATATGSAYNSGNNRWGDYSQIGVDPLDNMTMWAFHQYTNSANSYGVRAVQMKAPAPPASPVLTANPANFCSNITTITITGTSVNNTEFFDPGADTGGPGFTRLTVTSSGGVAISNVTFVSPTVVTCMANTIGMPAGSYTLTITNPDGQITTAVYTLSSACTLPVKLLSFSGKLSGNEILLGWKTTQEYGMNGYNVEKSLDGTDFRTLGYVTAKGGAENNYHITDNKPFPGNNYYRLKMINTDGTYTYSEIVLIKTPAKVIYVTSMFPNPAKDKFTIEMFADKIQKINISVYDFAGRTVINENKTTAQGFQNHQLNLRTLAAGTYHVEIKTAAGAFIQSTNLIKE